MYFDPLEVLGFQVYAGLNWLIVTCSITFVVLFVSMLVLIVVRGSRGVGIFFQSSEEFFSDLIHLSPRRIWHSLAWHLSKPTVAKRSPSLLSSDVVYVRRLVHGDTKEIKADQ